MLGRATKKKPAKTPATTGAKKKPESRSKKRRTESANPVWGRDTGHNGLHASLSALEIAAGGSASLVIENRGEAVRINPRIRRYTDGFWVAEPRGEMLLEAGATQRVEVRRDGKYTRAAANQLVILASSGKPLIIGLRGVARKPAATLPLPKAKRAKPLDDGGRLHDHLHGDGANAYREDVGKTRFVRKDERREDVNVGEELTNIKGQLEALFRLQTDALEYLQESLTETDLTAPRPGAIELAAGLAMTFATGAIASHVANGVKGFFQALKKHEAIGPEGEAIGLAAAAGIKDTIKAAVRASIGGGESGSAAAGALPRFISLQKRILTGATMRACERITNVSTELERHRDGPLLVGAIYQGLRDRRQRAAEIQFTESLRQWNALRFGARRGSPNGPPGRSRDKANWQGQRGYIVIHLSRHTLAEDPLTIDSARWLGLNQAVMNNVVSVNDPAMTLGALSVPYRLEIEGAAVIERLPGERQARLREATDEYFLADYWGELTGQPGRVHNAPRPDFVARATLDIIKRLESTTLGDLHLAAKGIIPGATQGDKVTDALKSRDKGRGRSS